jgi:hypothetical protein
MVQQCAATALQPLVAGDVSSSSLQQQQQVAAAALQARVQVGSMHCHSTCLIESWATQAHQLLQQQQRRLRLLLLPICHRCSC